MSAFLRCRHTKLSGSSSVQRNHLHSLSHEITSLDHGYHNLETNCKLWVLSNTKTFSTMYKKQTNHKCLNDGSSCTECCMSLYALELQGYSQQSTARQLNTQHKHPCSFTSIHLLLCSPEWVFFSATSILGLILSFLCCTVEYIRCISDHPSKSVQVTNCYAHTLLLCLRYIAISITHTHTPRLLFIRCFNLDSTRTLLNQFHILNLTQTVHNYPSESNWKNTHTKSHIK